MRPVNVYAELTPNPNSLKFVADVMLLEGGTVEFKSKEEAEISPLAQGLFDFTGVTGVFITSNFITVNKINDLDWYDITQILREYIRAELMSGTPLFTRSPFIENERVKQDESVLSSENKKDEMPVIDDPDAAKKIVELLEEYVKPAVEGDGGAISFRSYSEGVVQVVLKGACSGCPSSTVTLKGGIENLLKQMVPGVKEVVAVEE